MDNPDPELNTRFANWNKDKHIVPKIKECFVNHGARPVETSHLQVAGCQNLYGSSCSRRIVPLKNGKEHKEQVCLRFDHTVPLAKMVGSGNLQHTTKVYQMGPVFRRSPEGERVEEYKCDMDILGSHDPMIPDSECILVIFSAISVCGISTQNVMIRINHCRLLTGIMTHCSVPDGLQPAVRSMLVSSCSVIVESLVEAGLSREVATSLESYIVQRGGNELLAKLKHDVRLMENQDVQKGIENLEQLFQYCQALRVPAEVLKLDISFVRELDYYTGVVFEALLLGKPVCV
jgi:histidyl-tRNA synthetase